MKKTLSSLVDRVRRAEAAITARVDGAVGDLVGATARREPLEVVQAAVEVVAREIQPAGRGRQGFPFDRIDVTFAAPDARARARLRAVAEGPEPLRVRIENRLRAAGCLPARLTVNVRYVARPRRDWDSPDLHVVCAVDETPAPVVEASRLELVVVAGRATRSSFVIGADEVALGRGVEVCDTRGQLVRTNTVVFTEGGDEINQTVSRLHARIRRDPDTGTFRIQDDGSAQGTSIVRGGRSYRVPRGARGLAIAVGDEIVLGRARLRVKGRG